MFSKESIRLVNPSKLDIGRIRKKILDKTNQRVIQESKVDQWKNTDTVTTWFKSLPDKSCLSFVNFDIESFYPSISLNLFQQAINFPWEKVRITDTDISIITQARKTLLFHDGIPSVKRSDNEGFDVTMGSYDGSKVCKLVAAFLLNNLSHIIDKTSVGLYRDVS